MTRTVLYICGSETNTATRLQTTTAQTAFLRFDTIPAHDGQTDGHVAIAITHASLASHG